MEKHGITERLRVAFKSAGISQSEWALRAGVSSSLVSQWLSGKKFPSVGRLESAIGALGMTMTDFYAVIDAATEEAA